MDHGYFLILTAVCTLDCALEPLEILCSILCKAGVGSGSQGSMVDKCTLLTCYASLLARFLVSCIARP